MAVAAGTWHSLLLLADDTVQSMGYKRSGQLGRADGLLTEAPHPDLATIAGLSEVTAIAAGTLQSVAVRRDGTVWSWGTNSLGQLGYADDAGTSTPRAVPKQIPGITDIVAITTGRSFAAALRRDGTVLTWGENSSGQLVNLNGRSS